MKKIFTFIILIGVIILLPGCNILKNDVMEDINVYTTTYPNNYLIKF